MRSYLVHLVLLFLALGSPSFAQETEVVATEGAPLSIECSLRLEQPVVWSVDGAPPATDLRAAELPPAAGMARARLTAPAARARHAGRYTCSRGPDARAVRLRVLPRSSGPADPVTTTDLPGDPADDLNVYMYELAGDGAKPILLNCTVDDNTETFTYTWKKDDKDLDTVETLKGKFTTVEGVFKTNGKGSENESGNYTCYINGKAAQTWSVEAKNIAKLPSDYSVVEGQKLKLVCKLHGKPFKPVTWLYSLYDGDDANYTEVKTLLGDRVTLTASEVGVPNGQLVIEQAQRSDAGSYQCLASAGDKMGVVATTGDKKTTTGDKKGVVATTVRVKGMYDALWPFLGICAEVVVLCAIILAYEKRRAKPELEDSDADNHEQ